MIIDVMVTTFAKNCNVIIHAIVALEKISSRMLLLRMVCLGQIPLNYHKFNYSVINGTNPNNLEFRTNLYF